MAETRIFSDDEDYARGEYIRLMRARCGRFDRVFDRSKRMNDLTEQTYVRQLLGEMVPAEERVPTSRGLEERYVEQLREFQEALDLHSQVVVIGRAGRGKTSLLYWAMLEGLQRLQHDDTAVVPVYLPLKDFYKGGSLSDLKEYLDAQLADVRVSHWLWSHIQKGHVWLLLDALDEVPRETRLAFLNARGLLAELVRTLTAPQARLVLTCRDSVYAEVRERLSECKRAGAKDGFIKLELKPFKRDQILAYAQHFFGGDTGRVQAFLHDIEDPRGRSSTDERASRYTHLAEEPLYLHMLCWLWAGMGEETATR